MDVLILTVFASVVIVAAGLLFFAWNVHQGTHEHTDHLALLPLEEESVQRHPGPHDKENA